MESRVFDVEVIDESEEGGEKQVRLKLLCMYVIII